MQLLPRKARLVVFVQRGRLVCATEPIYSQFPHVNFAPYSTNLMVYLPSHFSGAFVFCLHCLLLFDTRVNTQKKNRSQNPQMLAHVRRKKINSKAFLYLSLLPSRSPAGEFIFYFMYFFFFFFQSHLDRKRSNAAFRISLASQLKLLHSWRRCKLRSFFSFFFHPPPQPPPPRL